MRSSWRNLAALFTGWVAVVVAAAPLKAQECAGLAEQACNATVHDVLVLQPRLGIGFTGGNPIPGASSTLGMRIGKVPRMTIGARFTGATLDVRGDDLLTSINLDAGVGVFSGVTLAPTVGGFASFDLFASAGKAFISEDISRDDPASFAVGARLGILRESFTAPGVSITGQYRKIGDLEYGLLAPGGSVERYEVTDNSVLSFRGIVGKRLFVFGAAIGVGLDRYTSDIHVERAVSPLPGMQDFTEFTSNGHDTDRKTVFANLSWTLLILNLVAEGGWQSGGDRFRETLPAGRTSQTQEGTYYGSLAIRLAL